MSSQKVMIGVYFVFACAVLNPNLLCAWYQGGDTLAEGTIRKQRKLGPEKVTRRWARIIHPKFLARVIANFSEDVTGTRNSLCPFNAKAGASNTIAYKNQGLWHLLEKRKMGQGKTTPLARASSREPAPIEPSTPVSSQAVKVIP